MSPDLTLEQYADTLRRMHTAIHGWERWALQHVPAQYRDLLAQRQRGKLIQSDLRTLGEPLASEDSTYTEDLLSGQLLDNTMDSTPSPAHFLGAMYVVEGSTLGGQYIAKYVEEKFGFVPTHGNAYFGGYGGNTGSMWRAFKQELTALPDEDTDKVIAAARIMFGVFATAMAPMENASLAAPPLVSLEDIL